MLKVLGPGRQLVEGTREGTGTREGEGNSKKEGIRKGVTEKQADMLGVALILGW